MDASLGGAQLFILAPSSGCVYAVDGNILGARVLEDNRFVSVSAGQSVCIPPGSVVLVSLTPRAYVALPPADVSVRSAFLSSVHVSTYPGHVFVSISPLIWPLFLIGLLVIGAAIAWSVRRKRVATPDSPESRIIAYVAEHPGCTQKDICNALGLEKYQVSRILARLEKQGRVVRVRRGISKRVYLSEQLQ